MVRPRVDAEPDIDVSSGDSRRRRGERSAGARRRAEGGGFPRHRLQNRDVLAFLTQAIHSHRYGTAAPRLVVV